MLITITKVHPTTEPILMGNITAPRYWVDFTSVPVSGPAIFVPAKANAEPLNGQSFFVETDYKTISDYQIFTKVEKPSTSIKPLPNPGDYEIIAEVKSVISLGDEINMTIISVEVGETRFTLTVNEQSEQVPIVGEVVYFKLVELSLWDENI